MPLLLLPSGTDFRVLLFFPYPNTVSVSIPALLALKISVKYVLDVFIFRTTTIIPIFSLHSIPLPLSFHLVGPIALDPVIQSRFQFVRSQLKIRSLYIDRAQLVSDLRANFLGYK